MNTKNIKKDYDIFARDETLVYLDSCATSLTPRAVTAKILEYYNSYNANVARGAYTISARATEEFESSRRFVANFINAQPEETVFTSGTTASLNMIAYGLAGQIKSSNNIVTTAMEHHANFIPWQELCKNSGADFRITKTTQEGLLDQENLLNLIDENTKILALTHVSNVLGTINPIDEIIKQVRAKNSNTIIVIDAAQSVSHLPIDVANIDCDFLAFSMHKLFGPTGVGVLFGKKSQLEKLTPIFTGGEMIEEVTSTCTTFRELPHRLEAGTPNIAGVIATKETIAYTKQFSFDEIREHETSLLTHCQEQLQENFGNDITIYGPTNVTLRCGAISFTF
ncbi:MAG: aminotransferase class V-fold PLP-dependent enzyme, partial [Patescibacteria group bacterium]